MRINRFVAQASRLSRRSADVAIISGRVKVNGQHPSQGAQIKPLDVVELDGQPLTLNRHTTLMLHKPVGYVCSRAGQGSKTIYDLLPVNLHHLKPVGRLDKDSSGLLLLSNDGQLANRLTHPRYQKQKIYEVSLDKPLSSEDKQMIEEGVSLEDGVSNLVIQRLAKSSEKLVPNAHFLVTMTEGRNRQIRRTFGALCYRVTSLHRTKFGPYRLNDIAAGCWLEV
jgi:23S rRNA pseudouridine2605 synthase